MTVKTNWNSRTSALGGYAGCSMRAWLDHGLQTGRLKLSDWGISPKETRTSSPPADFGSCCHWYSQSALRCEFKVDKAWNDMTFKGWNDATCMAAKPDKSVWDNGYKLFATPAVGEEIMKNMAKGIKQYMPGTSGMNWMAESCFEIPGLLNGHIDFLSDDLDHIVDLKTTSQKPSRGRPKPAHVWQLIGYALGVYHATGHMPAKGHIIYAHSRGDWIFRAKPVKFRSAIVSLMMEQLIKRLQIYSNWDALSGMATPSFGSACEDFCPYTHCCRDAAIPHGTTIRDRGIDPLGSANPLI